MRAGIGDLLGLADADEGREMLLPAEARGWADVYMSAGWAVMPGPGLDAWGTCACHLRAGCGNAGKHAHRGWGNAERKTLTRDAATGYWADENWDVLGGEAVDNVFLVPYLSGLVVADIDDMDAWKELPDAGYDTPETLRARTGSGRGEHWVYSFPWTMTNEDGTFRDPPRIRGRLPRRAGDVRFRAVIVAPPSVHVSGGRYEWVNWHAGARVAPAPAWLVEERDEPVVNPEALLPGWATKLLLAKDVDDARRLSELTEGSNRPTVMFACATRLGRWVAAGLLDRGTAEELLMESAAVNGALEKYGEDDFLRQMRNGLDEGARSRS